MQKTTNYQLNKPEAGDPIRVADFNQNSDIIDAALGELANNRPYVIGSYIGTNSTARNVVVELGFQPSAVLIEYLGDAEGTYGTLITPNHPLTYSGSVMAQITQTGFEVASVTASGSVVKPYVNLGGPYIYIAFR